MSNNTQVRGIHQGFVTFAQSNNVAGQNGYFPGLNARGEPLPNGHRTGHSGDGTHPGAVFWMMLEDNYFTPEYIINAADARAIETPFDDALGHYEPITSAHYSYAILGLAEARQKTEDGIPPGLDQRSDEWTESLNTSAVMLSDRAIGTGRHDLSSVWTMPGSGDWRGGLTHNDNSTATTNTHIVENTQYGQGQANSTDDVFEDDPNADDAFLVHQDATTAYSAQQVLSLIHI